MSVCNIAFTSVDHFCQDILQNEATPELEWDDIMCVVDTECGTLHLQIKSK